MAAMTNPRPAAVSRTLLDQPGSDAHRVALVPTGAAALFVLLALTVPIARAQQLLNGDGDLARHLRVGSYILDRRGLFYHDVFSYTMQGRPFVPYEWLSEVLYTLAERAGGLAGVAVLAGLVIAATYALVTLFLTSRAIEPFLAFVVGALAAATGELHWLARPHLFTALGAIVTIALLETADRRRLWPVVPLFVLWANLHGGFLFGLILIGIYAVGDAVELWLAKRDQRLEWGERVISDLKLLALALLACLINPTGPALFAHVTGYLGKSYLIDSTQEYQSPTFHVFSTQIFLGVLLLVVAALAISRQRPAAPRLLLILVDLAFALYSVRNVELFAVTALPVAALHLDHTWRGLLMLPNRLAALARGLAQRFARGEAQGVPWSWPLLVTCFLVVVALDRGSLAGVSFVEDHFDPARFPVEAVARARAAGLSGHLFNDFAWGGYLLYAWPEQKVFIDGQTDFYGESLTRTYATIVDLDPGWRTALRSWDVRIVIVPARSRLAAELEQEPGWRIWYRDPTAVILRRGS